MRRGRLASGLRSSHKFGVPIPGGGMGTGESVTEAFIMKVWMIAVLDDV